MENTDTLAKKLTIEKTQEAIKEIEKIAGDFTGDAHAAIDGLTKDFIYSIVNCLYTKWEMFTIAKAIQTVYKNKEIQWWYE